MLGDNPEKSKNPLKKAMRRRNAKTVNFAPPTYYEPDERDWSDEEEDIEGEEGQASHIEGSTIEEQQQQSQQDQQDQQNHHAQQAQQVDQSTEPQRAQAVTATIHRVETSENSDDDVPSSPIKAEVQAPAPLQPSSQDNVQRSRKGVVRNTDSFFKDDTVETKKISLTPRLLRGDGDSTGSAEQESKQQPSLDAFDKFASEDKTKDNKKKEKKGVLSSFFKRKDKGNKSGKHDIDEVDRTSEESGRSPQSKDSTDPESAPERKPSKLQKAPPNLASPKASPVETRPPQGSLAPIVSQQHGPPAPQKDQPLSPQATQPSQHHGPASQQQQPSKFPSLQDKRSVFAPITGALRSKNSSQDMDHESHIKPVYSKRAKERFAIDDSDSEDDSTPTAQSSILHRSISPLDHNERNGPRPDSGIPVSPLDGLGSGRASPDAIRALSTSDTKPIQKSGLSHQTTTATTPTSPSDQTASTSKHSPSVATHTPSTSRSTPTWSDASLRSYMDNDQDIRDLLVIVHDKTNITPVGPEHPLMNGLYAAERMKLADMQSQLDKMLLGWLNKKNQVVAAKV